MKPRIILLALIAMIASPHQLVAQCPDGSAPCRKVSHPCRGSRTISLQLRQLGAYAVAPNDQSRLRIYPKRPPHE